MESEPHHGGPGLPGARGLVSPERRATFCYRITSRLFTRLVTEADFTPHSSPRPSPHQRKACADGRRPMRAVVERLGPSSMASRRPLRAHLGRAPSHPCGADGRTPEAADRVAATVSLRRMNGGQRTYNAQPRQHRQAPVPSCRAGSTCSPPTHPTPTNGTAPSQTKPDTGRTPPAMLTAESRHGQPLNSVDRR